MKELIEKCIDELKLNLDADLLEDVSIILEKDGDVYVFTAIHQRTQCRLDIQAKAIDSLPTCMPIIGDQLQVSNGRQTFSERRYSHLVA